MSARRDTRERKFSFYFLSRVARLKTHLSACNTACCARANGLAGRPLKGKKVVARGRLHTDDSTHFTSKIPSRP